MDFWEVLTNRRSIRNFTDQPIEKELVEKLLWAATQAPSAMNSQPWAFAVIQDKALLKQYSDQAKTYLLSVLDDYPPLIRYQAALSNPDFNIFYGASTLLIILARSTGPHPNEDCCLAAQSTLLAAHALGLGTCWIGFATPLLNQPKVKEELDIPADYSVVAPLIVGYPQGNLPPSPRNQPEVLFWK